MKASMFIDCIQRQEVIFDKFHLYGHIAYRKGYYSVYKRLFPYRLDLVWVKSRAPLPQGGGVRLDCRHADLDLWAPARGFTPLYPGRSGGLAPQTVSIPLLPWRGGGQGFTQTRFELCQAGSHIGLTQGPTSSWILSKPRPGVQTAHLQIQTGGQILSKRKELYLTRTFIAKGRG